MPGLDANTNIVQIKVRLLSGPPILVVQPQADPLTDNQQIGTDAFPPDSPYYQTNMPPVFLSPGMRIGMGGPPVLVHQPLQTAIVVPMGQAIETDSAFSISIRKIRSIGLATETDTAQVVTPQKRITLSLPTETDTAQVIRPARGRTLSIATETDSAFSITGRRVLEIGLATDINLALPIQSQFNPVIIYRPDDPDTVEVVESTRPTKIIRQN